VLTVGVEHVVTAGKAGQVPMSDQALGELPAKRLKVTVDPREERYGQRRHPPARSRRGDIEERGVDGGVLLERRAQVEVQSAVAAHVLVHEENADGRGLHVPAWQTPEYP
ncbi:MAG TPA: hypothetical protein VM287_10655, partial [Egibacteraceae bacterium]|nr:hypothetical protein [Egibacteraceae bacterium]